MGRLGLRTKLVALAFVAAALPVLAFLGSAGFGRQAASQDVAEELDRVAQLNLGQYVRDLHTTCRTIDEMLAPTLDTALGRIRRAIAAAAAGPAVERSAQGHQARA